MLTVVRKKQKSGGGARVVSIGAMAPRSHRQRRRRPTQTRSPFPSLSFAQTEFATSYANTMTDPFEYPPVKLGFGCLVDTALTVGYRRSSLVVNADGSFGLAHFPTSSNGFVCTNTGGAGVVGWATSAATNAGAIGNSFSNGRVVSGGIRCFALLPATATPGILYAGTFPIATFANFNNFTIAQLSEAPSSEMGIGTTGAAAVSRPQDTDSFVFFSWAVRNGGYVTNNVASQRSIPYIVGRGFPAGTQIFFEAVVNIEALSSDDVNSVSPYTNEAPPVTGSSLFNSAEQLYRTVEPILGNAAIMDAAEVGAHVIHPSFGSAMGMVRRAFSSGRNARIAIGSHSMRAAREQTAIIEEINDEHKSGL